jgi:signal transduction histidine kinase
MEVEGELTVTTSLVEQETRQHDLWGRPTTEAHICLAIRDNGRGIRPEDIPHVFDPFFTTKSTGTGLGLSVAHGIIHEHGGFIDVKSELNQGTTFILLFPLARQGAPA